MTIKTTFFEDDYLQHFHPLTLTRPVYDLRVGILTLGQKWNACLNIRSEPSGPLRESLKNIFPKPAEITTGETSFWINPRVFPDTHLLNVIKNLDEDTAILQNNKLIAAKVGVNIHQHWLREGIDPALIPTQAYDSPITVLDNIWQIFQFNGSEIKHDLNRLSATDYADPEMFPHSVLVNKDQIFIEDGAIIEPGAIIYAEKGPVFIGRGARIMANAVIRGTTAVCENSVVKMGAKIYKDTTIGPVCKVGGEISNVVFHSYSNKAHDGYAGNSVLGQWCNIGADTNTSNLKNNYSTVKFRKWDSTEVVDSGQQFLGTIMGDHTKTGINSMLNTGTICGVSCNIFSDGFPPKYIPSFSWVGGKDIVPYHFEKAIEAMEKMMIRRDVKLTPAYKNMMQTISSSAEY